LDLVMATIPFNPYIVGNPIKSRDMFFGREDDFHFVQQKIGEGRSNQIVVLCGERRSGKTSILFQILGGRLGDAFLPVLIDMQMLAGVSGDREFFRAILRAGCTAPALAGLTLEEVEAAADGGPVDLMRAFLAEVERRAPGRIALFLLDEYELIEAKIRDASLGESTIHAFSGILESPHRVSFVFTGSTNLEDRKVDVWKSLLGKSIYRKISYLSRRDTLRLITEPLKDSVAWPAEVAESVCRLTGGQPFYTQVICQNMIDLLVEEDRTDPAAGDLDRVVRGIVDNPLPQMIYSWNSVGEEEQVVLSSLAGRLDDAGGWAGTADVLQFLGGNRILLPFPRERVNVLLEIGYHSEFLEKRDDGSYHFKMDLFRRWIRREHSIWKVAREARLRFRSRVRPGAVAGIAAAGLIGLLAAAWFLPWPPALVAFRGRLASLLGPPPEGVPSTEAASSTAAGTESLRTEFRANRGPFRLAIDGGPTLTSEGQADPRRIVVDALARGRHRYVATPLSGFAVTADVEVTSDGQVVGIVFAAVAAAAPMGRTAEALPGGTAEAQAGAAEETSATATAAEEISASATAAGEASEAAASVEPAAEAPKPGMLVITTQPPGAEVTLDGAATGRKAPFVQSLAAGDHTVTVTLPGWKTSSLRLRLDEGGTFERVVVLEEAWAELTFDVRPRATILLDGKELLETPYTKPVRVQAGPHVLTIVNDALNVKMDVAVDLAEGESRLIQQVLKETSP
jgi:hypothetical protein